MLIHIFEDLCFRNFSPNLLEKESLFHFVKLSVILTQGSLGERIFQTTDTNNDGFIELKEFICLFEDYCRSETILIVEKLFKLCDLNGDNVLDRQELFQMVLYN